MNEERFECGIRDMRKVVDEVRAATVASLEVPTCYLCHRVACDTDGVVLHQLRGHAHRWLCDRCGRKEPNDDRA